MLNETEGKVCVYVCNTRTHTYLTVPYVRNCCGEKQMRSIHTLSKTSGKGLKRSREGFAAQVVEVKPILSEYILI